MWQLGDETWTHLRPESDHRDALQGDLHWRFFRAAQELKSISGCTLTLVPPSLQKPSPDFVHTELLLASYIKILGAKTLSMATLVCCHCTQELLRTKWEWVPRDCSDPDYTGPGGNWETTDGTRFLCQWVDACPPSKICSAALCVTSKTTTTNTRLSKTSTTPTFSIAFFLCLYLDCIFSVCIS